jgi:hypothetical protein
MFSIVGLSLMHLLHDNKRCIEHFIVRSNEFFGYTEKPCVGEVAWPARFIAIVNMVYMHMIMVRGWLSVAVSLATLVVLGIFIQEHGLLVCRIPFYSDLNLEKVSKMVFRLSQESSPS